MRYATSEFLGDVNLHIIGHASFSEYVPACVGKGDMICIFARARASDGVFGVTSPFLPLFVHAAGEAGG